MLKESNKNICQFDLPPNLGKFIHVKITYCAALKFRESCVYIVYDH